MERYFTIRLMQQRNASGNTIASYRDTFRLLLKFAQAKLRKPPSALTLNDLDAPFISAFLAVWATNQLKQRRPTCMPISRSKRWCWTSLSPTSATNQNASGQVTACSPSLNRCEAKDYAEWRLSYAGSAHRN
jgi:site-specific recombinase XerD